VMRRHPPAKSRGKWSTSSAGKEAQVSLGLPDILHCLEAHSYPSCYTTPINNTIMGKFSEAFKHSDHKEPLEPPPTFQEATFAPPAPSQGGSSNQPPSFACLLLSSSDKLRTVNFPEHTFSHIEEAIKRVWAPGIQSQKYQSPGNYEWKLVGRPCTSTWTHLTFSWSDQADSRVRLWLRSNSM